MEQIYGYISGLLASNEFLQGGAILGILTAVFYKLKTIPTLIWTKFKYYATYQVYFDESTDIYHTFSAWFHEKYPQKFRNVEVRFFYDDAPGQTRNMPTLSASSENPRKSKWRLRKFQYSDSNLIFYKNRWLWVRKNREKLDAAREMYSMFLNSYAISGLFAQNAIDALCAEILEKKLAETEQHALRVGINTDGGHFEYKNVDIVKTFDHIFFADKEKLIRDIDSFVKKKEFYRSKGINFKRSYLLFGRGGTGKTSVATAIASYLGYDLCVINLASIKDDLVLQRCSSNISSRTVILLEDIDCILTDRNVNHDKLNFSTVLNFLDGLYAPSDCVFVITTNKPEVLDDALIRKGRVDLALHIDYPSSQEIEAFMSDFYETEITLPVGFSLNKPMAEVQDICLRNEVAEIAKREVLWLPTKSNGTKSKAAVI